MEFWHFVESAYKILIVPLGAAGTVIWYIFRKYDKKFTSLEERVHAIELEHAILDTKIDALKEGIDDIKHQLSRLFDILEKRRNP